MELSEVMRVLEELSLSVSHVKELAFKLGVGLPQLDDVDTEYHGAKDRRNHYMQAWLDNDPDPSWAKVEACLKDMRMNRPAAILAARVGIDDGSCSSASVPKPPSAVEPTLPTLLRLRVPGQVAARASDFGIFLLDDAQGATVMNLEKKHQRDGVAVAKEVLELWLQGKGLEVTWKNLIDTLRDIDQCVLANQVEEYVKKL